MLWSSFAAVVPFSSKLSKKFPHGAVLVFSAHVSLPPFATKPKLAPLKVIDATCPLVTKVHFEALKFAREDRTIILIGHKDHQEIIGTSGEAARPHHRRPIRSKP